MGNNWFRIPSEILSILIEDRKDVPTEIFESLKYEKENNSI
ncbi:MAG TPA: hypothetical protein PK079_14020 [Leptospiraceae bacterium]|nr:hypothetical protein [Leptospiraceae bacterium]HMX33337.1 hypothetical protein [Leptospiraceae bacterium]HMY34082.1 hypothetical protein [Leptospiraceae bacterium]HMZ64599.1 hypothetical protein [Leptospiraceae bacterium]HNA09078.1 hypothetical protein [Leptospiraceae bacterium]